MGEKNVHRFLYKRDKPMPMFIGGVFIVLFGVLGWSESVSMGIVLLSIGVALLIYQNGIEVDSGNKRYRYISSLGMVRMGKWRSLPELKCLSVFKTKLVSRTYGRSNASITTEESVVQVNLVSESNERIKLLEVENLDEAVVFAKDWSKKLDTRVWDAADREGKWLES